jgi:hypothetical protein
VLINKTIKAITRLRYDHPTSDLYGGDIMHFDGLNIFQDIRNGLIKHNVVQMLLVDVHHHDTKNQSRGDFYVDISRTNLGRQSIMLPYGLIRYNNLSREIRDSRILIEFKRELKKTILRECFISILKGYRGKIFK